MVSKQIIGILRIERNKLRKLATKQNNIIREKRLIKEEERKLRIEIRKLRLETSKRFTARIRRATPITRKRLIRAKKVVSKHFRRFQAVADKMPK